MTTIARTIVSRFLQFARTTPAERDARSTGRRGASAYERARFVGVLLGIPLTIYSLTRIF